MGKMSRRWSYEPYKTSQEQKYIYKESSDLDTSYLHTRDGCFGFLLPVNRNY